MNKFKFYCLIFFFSLISFSAKTQKYSSRLEIGFCSYDIDIEYHLKELNQVFAEKKFPTIKYIAIQCGTFKINSKNQKLSLDIKLGGSYQIRTDGDFKTHLQNIVLIFEYRYNIFSRNEHWVFYPAFSYGATLGTLSLIKVNQHQFNLSVDSIDVSDYSEKKYKFSTVFVFPKIGVDYQFKILKPIFSVGLEMGYQLAINANLYNANRTFAYINTPKFNLSGFIIGFNIKIKLSSLKSNANSAQQLPP